MKINRVLFLVLIIALVVALTLTLIVNYFKLSAPQISFSENITSYSYHQTESIANYTELSNLGPIQNVIIKAPAEVEISPGKYSITASKDFIGKLNYQVKNQTLILNAVSRQGKIFIKLPKLVNLQLSGSPEVKLKEFKLNNPLTINISGTADLKLENSEFNYLILQVTGAAELNSKNCKLSSVKLEASGSSEIKLNRFYNGLLEGEVSGMAEISYTGNLTKNRLKTSGLVQVKKLID